MIGIALSRTAQVCAALTNSRTIKVLLVIFVSAALLSGGLVFSSPPQNFVGGGAVGAGAGITGTVSGLQVTASLPAVAPVTLPPDGGTFTNQAASASTGSPGGLPGSSTGTVTDTTTGTITQSSAHAQSSSTVNGMSMLGGLITATQIVSMAASDANGKVASSTAAGSFAEGLTVAGTLFDQREFPPNTIIPFSGNVAVTVGASTQNVPVTGTVIVNAQSFQGDGLTTSALNVDFLHVTVGSSGPGPVTFREDMVVASASSSVSFTPGLPSNSPPSLNLPGPQTVQVGSTLNFNASATDPDAGDVVSLGASGLPPGAAFTPNPATGNPATGQLSFTPSQSQAGQSFTVNFSATDSHGAVITGSVPITVLPPGSQNHAPILSVPGPQIIGVGQTLRFIVTATDPDGDTIALSASGVPAGGSFNPTTGEFAFTPTGDQVGQVYAVDFTATDTKGASTSAPVQITVVTSTNPHSTVISVPPSVNPIEVNVDDNLLFRVSAVSSPGCPVTISASNLPENASFDPATNTFSFTPASSQKGKVFTVTFTATDCRGQTATATVTIIVVDPNAAGPGHICVPVCQISFAPTPVGGSCGAVSISLSNMGSGPLTINSIGFLEGNDFSVDGASALPAVIPSGGTIQLRLAFQPKEAGMVRDSLTISTSDPDQPNASIDLKGKGVKQ